MRSQVALAAVLVSGTLIGGTALADDATVKVTISRQYPGAKCTSGYLAVDGKIIAYALERPWLDNINDISSIPAGKYKAHLRYDKGDHWRIQLEGVPHREWVQIHVGNQPDQSKGCILVGEKLGKDLCSVEGSKNAYAKLRRAFNGSDKEADYDPRDIIVEIIGDEKSSK